MKIAFEYEQHAIVRCVGEIEVPASVIEKGVAAIRDYIEENEEIHETEIVDWMDRVERSFEMDYEAD